MEYGEELKKWRDIGADIEQYYALWPFQRRPVIRSPSRTAAPVGKVAPPASVPPRPRERCDGRHVESSSRERAALFPPGFSRSPRVELVGADDNPGYLPVGRCSCGRQIRRLESSPFFPGLCSDCLPLLQVGGSHPAPREDTGPWQENAIKHLEERG